MLKCIFQISSDLENVIEQRRSISRKRGLPMLPFVVVESPSTFDKINQVYVSFDQIIYKVSSFLKGLDVCFQIIHVLNLVYPFESHHIWMFIHLAMYELRTKFDNFPA